jgi:hypothetical protein
MEKLATVKDESDACGLPAIPQQKIDAILGDNFARLMGLLEG